VVSDRELTFRENQRHIRTLPCTTQESNKKRVEKYIPVEHGSMLEHVGKHNKDNLAAANVHLRAFPFDARPAIGDDAVLDVEIHLVFGFKEQATDQFALFVFNLNDRPLCVVQDHDGDSNAIITNDRHDVIASQ